MYILAMTFNSCRNIHQSYVSNGTCGIIPDIEFFLFLAGGELDLMARRVLCAGTAELAQQVAACIEQIELERD